MRIVGGIWGGRRIAAPPGRLTRPTTDRVREAWMSAIAVHLPGARVADLFAGSGALGIEALSRGAEHATFVESSADVVRLLRRNLESLGAPPASYRIAKGDVMRVLADTPPGEFDVALADPPYATGAATKLVELYLAHPFARLLCVEHAPQERIGGEPIWERRYGDTSLTFLEAHDLRE